MVSYCDDCIFVLLNYKVCKGNDEFLVFFVY